jgi:hypothetical protein
MMTKSYKYAIKSKQSIEAVVLEAKGMIEEINSK